MESEWLGIKSANPVKRRVGRLTKDTRKPCHRLIQGLTGLNTWRSPLSVARFPAGMMVTA